MWTEEEEKFKNLIKWGEANMGTMKEKGVGISQKKNQLQQQPLCIIKCILLFNHAQMTVVFC